MADDTILSIVWSRLARFFNRPWISVVAFGILISLVAFWNRPPHLPIVNRGSAATFSYSAPFDFTYNSKLLRDEKVEEAMTKVMPSYKIDALSHHNLLEAVRLATDYIVANFDELSNAAPLDCVTAIQSFLSSEDFEEKLKELGVTFPQNFAENLYLLVRNGKTGESVSKWIDQLCHLYDELAATGIASDELSAKNIRTLSQFRRDLEFSLEDILYRKVYEFNQSREALQRNINASMSILSALELLSPNVAFDSEATKAAQEAAANAVPEQPVVVREGDTLLTDGELITDAVYERWQAFRQEMTADQSEFLGGSKNFAGNTLFVLLVTIAGVLAGRLLVPELFKRRGIRGPIRAVGTLIFVNIFIVRLILEIMDSPTVDLILTNSQAALAWLATTPIFIALLCSIIAGTPLAIVASGFLCGVIALMLDGDVGTFFPALVAALAAIHFSRGVTKRVKLIAAGFYVGLCVAGTIIFVQLYLHFGLLCGWVEAGNFALIGQEFSAILGNAAGTILLSTFLGLLCVMCLTPIEKFFQLTSNITLTELTDFNHPLLRMLQYYAPGTYNHSIAVSEYAATAAAKIGANEILCRCGALYHDIGKIDRAQFFTENKIEGVESPHTTLTPLYSAAVIRNHVRAGVKKADEFGLPQCIKDLILQHHGRSLVGFFLGKAQELVKMAGGDPNREIDEESFRYPGPNPQTKEAVILLCCDIVEAASRSLKDPSPASIEAFVKRMIDARMNAGEFSESPITLAELDLIKKSLVASVLKSNHSRISYSREQIKKDAQKFAETQKSPSILAKN